MKRILGILAVIAIATVAYAAPDVEPIRSWYQQYQYKVPEHFEKELNAAFIDAGTVTVSGTGKVTQVIATSVDAGAVRVQGSYTLISTEQDGGVTQMRLLTGYGVAGSNDLAVTFNPAFSAIPDCVCSSVNATAAACGVKAIPTASAVTFRGANASDAMYWSCHGPK